MNIRKFGEVIRKSGEEDRRRWSKNEQKTYVKEQGNERR